MPWLSFCLAGLRGPGDKLGAGLGPLVSDPGQRGVWGGHSGAGTETPGGFSGLMLGFQP